MWSPAAERVHMGDVRGALGICARAVAIATVATVAPVASLGSTTAAPCHSNPGKRLGVVSGPSGHCLESETGRIAASLASSLLLELSVAVGPALALRVALVDSWASHCFIAEHVARVARVSWDTGVHLGVRLADRELRPYLGLACAVHM